MVAYQRETTTNLHWNASANDVRNALEILPSFGTCTVTKVFETSDLHNPTWYVTFTHGNSGPPEFAMVGVGDQPMLVPNFRLLDGQDPDSLAHSHVNVTEHVRGTLPQDYTLVQVDANGVSSPFTRVIDGLRLSQTYFASVSAVNDRGEGERQVSTSPAPFIAPQRLAGPPGSQTTVLKTRSGTSLLVEVDENAFAGGHVQGCIQVETSGHCKGDRNVITSYRIEYATDASFVGAKSLKQM